MSSEERKAILQMVEDGRITADQALVLIRELEQDPPETGPEAAQAADGPGTVNPAQQESPAPELERAAARVRSLWQIPLAVGLLVAYLSAFGIYTVMQNAGYNFWFYCLWVPFFLGVAVVAIAAWSRTAHWLFVNVDHSRAHDGPRRIFLGFPLPLDLAGWFLRTFGSRIEGLRNTHVDEVVQAISMAKSMREPLIVNVDESGNGERVQVFIG
jgi:hypothetical protein